MRAVVGQEYLLRAHAAWFHRFLLFSRSSRVRCSDRATGRAFSQTVMAATEPAVRTGVDRPVFHHITVSGWLVWREAGFAGAALPLVFYALQLVLNAAWSPIFFGPHRPDLGFLDIVC
jgi:TspO/MBR family